jgi:hypothetical protein
MTPLNPVDLTNDRYKQGHPTCCKQRPVDSPDIHNSLFYLLKVDKKGCLFFWQPFLKLFCLFKFIYVE